MMKKMNLIQRFSLLCLLFVLTVVVLTGAAISHYAKKVFLEREGRLASEFVQAHWAGLFSGPDAQLTGKIVEELESIRNTPEVVTAKLYNRERTVVWSTRREMVGRAFPKNEELERAFRGETVVVLEAIRRKDHTYLKDYYDELVEIYTPILAGGGADEVMGVLSLYKSAMAIHKSIGEINRWIWLIAAGSGFLLYASLFWIFHATYKKQKRTEDSLKELTAKLSLSNAIASRSGLGREAENVLRDALKWLLEAAKADIARGYVIGEDREPRLVCMEKSLKAAVSEDIPAAPFSFLLHAVEKGRSVGGDTPSGLHCLAIPLSSHGRLHGAIEILSLKRIYYAVDFFDSLGSQVGMALENAILYSGAKDMAGRLETLVAEKTSDLKKSLDTVQTVLDSIDDCIIVHDLSHTILAGNRAASMAFDKDRNGVLGAKCHALFVGKDEPCSNCPSREVVARKETATAQIRDIRTGEAISVIIHPIINEKGEIVSLLEYADFLSGENAFEKKMGLSIVEAADRTPEIDFISYNKKMKEIAAIVEKIARLPSPVLLNGETGTGKEVVAKLIHHSCAERKGPFIAVNCGALSESLLESTLFGYEKGAFTGAVKTQKGYIEEASGGTLFLDEITETSPKLQTSLLRVLEEKAFYRLGSSKKIAVDFRLITASNRDVEKMVKEGAFRQDLFYRINIIPISLPPLRERVEDIAPLAQHFLRKFNREFNKKIGPFSPDALDILERCPWKGNVRELKNVLERIVSFKPTGEIVPEDIPLYIKTDFQKDARHDDDKGGGISLYLNLPFNKAKSLFEKRYLESMLKRTSGNIIRAADISGIKKQNLYGKIRKYEIKSGEE